MKKIWKLALALAVCAAALCLTAAAAEAEPDAETAPAAIRVWGTVSPWDGNGIFLKNSDGDDPFNQVVVNVGDAPIVDAVTALPLDPEDIKEGDTLYAWIGPAMTMSLPPQTRAIVVVGNVPADAAVPEYYEIAGNVVKPASEDVRVRVSDGEMLTISEDVEIGPWLTRQIVTLDDLIPGTQVLVWKDAQDRAEKIVVFPYAYKGYLDIMAASHGEVLACVNGGFDGESPQYSCKKGVTDGVLVPIRAVAEAAGYDVRWDKALGAVVSRNGEDILSAKPGAEVVQTPEGESGLSSPCVIENGVTYLPAEELCLWLNLFLSYNA